MTPEVLFMCVHNAGRSQLAAALLDHHARGRVVVRSAGSAPAAQLNPAVVEVLAELGIDLAGAAPKPLADDAVRASDVVVSMGCGDACPVFPGKRYLTWELDDPAGRSLAEVRVIRDEIDRRVRALLCELTVAIRPMVPADADPVLAIYAAGIATGDATFETAPPDWAGFDASRLPAYRFVAVDRSTGAVLGWGALSPVSHRCVYQGVAEHSIYVHPDAWGRGIGAALLSTLIDETETGGIWTLQSGIFPENAASVALHLKLGFRVVGRRERLGRHHGRWRDVLLLERRSPTLD